MSTKLLTQLSVGTGGLSIVTGTAYSLTEEQLPTTNKKPITVTGVTVEDPEKLKDGTLIIPTDKDEKAWTWNHDKVFLKDKQQDNFFKGAVNSGYSTSGNRGFNHKCETLEQIYGGTLDGFTAKDAARKEKLESYCGYNPAGPIPKHLEELFQKLGLMDPSENEEQWDRTYSKLTDDDKVQTEDTKFNLHGLKGAFWTPEKEGTQKDYLNGRCGDWYLRRDWKNDIQSSITTTDLFFKVCSAPKPEHQEVMIPTDKDETAMNWNFKNVVQPDTQKVNDFNDVKQGFSTTTNDSLSAKCESLESRHGNHLENYSTDNPDNKKKAKSYCSYHPAGPIPKVLSGIIPTDLLDPSKDETSWQDNFDSLTSHEKNNKVTGFDVSGLKGAFWKPGLEGKEEDYLNGRCGDWYLKQDWQKSENKDPKTNELLFRACKKPKTSPQKRTDTPQPTATKDTKPKRERAFQLRNCPLADLGCAFTWLLS